MKTKIRQWEILQDNEGKRLWLSDGKRVSILFTYSSTKFSTDFAYIPKDVEKMIYRYILLVCDSLGIVCATKQTGQLREHTGI